MERTHRLETAHTAAQSRSLVQADEGGAPIEKPRFDWRAVGPNVLAREQAPLERGSGDGEEDRASGGRKLEARVVVLSNDERSMASGGVGTNTRGLQCEA